MRYIAVSVGNTDNKLTQQDWNKFVEDVIDAVGTYGKVHFFGGASTWAPWQNVAWIVEVAPKDIDTLGDALTKIRKKYNQESVFIMVSEGMFI